MGGARGIRVGVAGWDYPDWNGVVYPMPMSRRFDRLAWISRFVDVVEINSTFYRPASPRAAESWGRRVHGRPGFRFTAKAHRSWTHEDAAPDAGLLSPTLEGLAPLREAGLLEALLLQFPQSFHRTPRAANRVEALLDLLVPDWPVVLETRHASWDADAAAAWARGRGCGWCVVDQPIVGRSTAPPTPRVTARIAYFRLHGRNATNWFREDAGRDARYDYLYSLEELLPLAESVRGMACAAESVVVVQNNHFRGQALANALQMKRLLQGGRPAAPQELVDAYPSLESDVVTERRTLF